MEARLNIICHTINIHIIFYLLVQSPLLVVERRDSYMTDESIPKKILSKPLPQVLNEIMETTERNDERIAQVEKTAKAAMNLAELLRQVLIEVASFMNKRLLAETSTPDNKESVD